MVARRAERMQRRAALLHDALALRPDQERAWQTFMTAMAPSETMMERRGPRGPDGDAAPLTTPERLDRMAERLNRGQAEFSRHAAAVREFYAVLSPTQQRTFDALATLAGRAMMHRRWGMHGMGHPGMPGDGPMPR